jgi:ComF family protein
MLKSIESFFFYIFNSVLPKRADFEIVKNLDEKTISKLSKGESLKGFDWIHPLFQYKDPKVKAIIWELKYKENILPLEHVGKILFDEIFSLISDIYLFDTDAKFILLPIPITSEKRRVRGYNQSELIAKAIRENDLSHSLLYAPQWFLKIKNTEEQNKTHGREERMRNLTGSFEADSRIQSYYVVLIDDVVTTGSTLSVARKELLEKGARDVFAFTIAH